MADSDRRSTLLDSYENAAVIVSGIDADELGHPTPCPKYDLAGLIDHLVERPTGRPLSAAAATPPGDGSPHVELSDAPGQLRSAAEEAAQAWGNNSSLSLRYTMPWGEEYTGATLVMSCLSWPHTPGTWPGPPDRSTSWTLPSPCRALEGARAMIKPQYRNMVEPGAPFGAEVSPAPAADDWERLAAFMGRDPGQRSVDKGPSAAPGLRSTWRLEPG